MTILVKADWDAPAKYRWYAYDNDTYDGAAEGKASIVGTGATKIEAVADWLRQMGYDI